MRWWLGRGRPDPFGIETMAMGAGVFAAFTWWWGHFGSGGLRRGMPVLLLLDPVALVAVIHYRINPTPPAPPPT